MIVLIIRVSPASCQATRLDHSSFQSQTLDLHSKA